MNKILIKKKSNQQGGQSWLQDIFGIVTKKVFGFLFCISCSSFELLDLWPSLPQVIENEKESQEKLECFTKEQ